ncbi:MAG: phosphoribosylanthranilate isomerase [Spirochaetaceae bacterium]|jgi:phosphoribosylanthranilate isomerase|nr:phosphoribosylanthranilate isomerase [Spirochaetaceae bacterium]
MRIKICGLFRDEDVDAVNEARPDYVGFVFAESRRRVSAREAARLRLRLDGGIVPVGVFVNAPLEDIARLREEGVIGMAQLHGNEDDEYIDRLKERGGLPVIRAVRMGPEGAGPEAFGNADYLLFDGPAAGSGARFDWSLLAALPPLLLERSFLAGGVNCDTMDEAIRLKPFCLDVSSGAETDGVKDRAKILRLVRRVRSVALEEASMTLSAFRLLSERGA